MSSKLVAAVLFLCFLNKSQAQVISGNREPLFDEFTRTLLNLAMIFENITDKSHSEAIQFLNFEVTDLKAQCKMNRNLQPIEDRRTEYEFVLKRTLSTDLRLPNSVPAYKALDLWTTMFSLFNEISHCYPDDTTFYFSSTKKVILNAMALMAKEIIKRTKFFTQYSSEISHTIPAECIKNQENKKTLFFQQLLMQMSLVSGPCDYNIEQRKCIMESTKHCSNELRNELKLMLGPIGSFTACDNF